MKHFEIYLEQNYLQLCIQCKHNSDESVLFLFLRVVGKLKENYEEPQQRQQS